MDAVLSLKFTKAKMRYRCGTKEPVLFVGLYSVRASLSVVICASDPPDIPGGRENRIDPGEKWCNLTDRPKAKEEKSKPGTKGRKGC